MAYQDIEESRLYKRAENTCDQIWDLVIEWKPFARDTIGNQLVRAADSIGANIAESAGRYSPGDAIRFLHFARGSLRETRFWLKRANKRQLIASDKFNHLFAELNTLSLELNNYIKYQRTRSVKEPDIEYTTDSNQQTNKPTNQQTNKPTNQQTGNSYAKTNHK